MDPTSTLLVSLFGALVVAPTMCRAQTLRGQISVRASGEPLPSSIVALVDSTGRIVATTLADDAGAFVLTAPAPGRYAVRVERVGYRSLTTAVRRLGSGDTVDLPIAISSDGISLRGIRVTADRRCVVRPQEGLAAAQLWDEARKALQTTTLTQMAQAAARRRRDPHRFTLRLRKFVRVLDPYTLTQRRVESYEVEGESVTPFSSRDPSLLARDGYVVVDADGGTTYYAPDATILLSDQFLDAHCLRVRAPDPGGREDLIGLAFEPVARLTRAQTATGERFVDVEGVLWLERATAELRYLDYGYTNLHLGVPTAQVGGQIEFRPLPDGRWVVWRWSIRMPQLERRRVTLDALTSRTSDSQLALSALHEEGGEIIEVLPAGARRAGLATVSGTVRDSLRGGPLVGARVFLSGTSFAATTGLDGRYRIDSVTPGTYSASVLAPRLDSLLLDAPVQQLSVSAGNDTQADFGIPAPSTLWQRWCPGVPRADSSGVILGIVRDTSGVRVTGASLAVEWNTFANAAGGKLVMRPQVIQSETIATGRFALCGVPPDARLTLRAAHGKEQQQRAELRLQRGEVRRVDLSLRAR